MLRKRLYAAILVILLGLPLYGLNVTPRQLIIKTAEPIELRGDRTGLTNFDSYLDQIGAFNLRPIKGMHIPNYYLIDLSEDPDWEEIRSDRLRFAGIEYVQPNYVSTLHITPNDPLYGQQFLSVISAPQAWNYTTGSNHIVIGIVDSGCLVDHPDLQANIWVNPGEIPNDGIDNDNNGYIDDVHGWDFTDAPEFSDTAVGDYIGQDNDVDDENFHGTHVAGIAGAVGNNGVGIAGVAWRCKIMPIRAGFRTTAGQGTLQDDDAAAALIYAADNGCHVVNMSWGDPNYSPIIADACDYAFSRGVTLIASAGNDPGPNLSYPAKLSNVISVGAINRNRNIAGFSSYGVDLDLVAPGELVLSTYKNEVGLHYFQQSGTSMSSPFVAGAAALLLALNPGLTPSEVRSRLLSSTDDLGAVGVDQFYGHGLLNLRKLLENTEPPLIYIDHPMEMIGITQSVDITGTVAGSDFFRYSVMYTSKDVPSILDWYDVATHQNYPVFHTTPVTNGTLASFYIPEGFSEGKYTIRVQYESMNGGKCNYFRSITFDRTPPVLKVETLQGFKRYNGQDLRHYISGIFDEPVRSRLIITGSDNLPYNCYGTKLDSLHVWTLPPTIPQGQISIQIIANNNSNLTYVSPVFSNFQDIQYEIITNYGFQWQEIGPARVPLNATYDYDGDGKSEYIAMDLPKSGYGTVKVYQPEAGGHVLKHSFNDSFWPLGVGNTNFAGQELLQLKADTAILMESQLTSNYPNQAIWEEGSITGGVIADYSNDGVDDLLLVKNLPAERVIQAYKRSGNTFLAKNTLRNTSQTNIRNTFVPTIIVKNLDGDSYRDILTADTDGDIMIYEIRNDNFSELTWSHRIPIGNAYTLTSGDFDGNGSTDFFVGGYYRDNVDPDMNFWYFEGFRNTSNNNYASMGSIMFNDVTSQNSIQAYDLDNDNKHEIILALSPNLYILKYQNNKFVPTFYGKSMRTYAMLATKDHDNNPFFTTNYEVEPDSIIAVSWKAQAPYTGPPTPVNFLASAQDNATVRLSWIENGSDFYRIYRKDEYGDISILDLIGGNYHLDWGLEEGKTYQYALTAFNDAYSPPESTPTTWQAATPFRIPELLSIEMASANTLRLIFDQQMAGAIINPTLYSVSHGMGSPTSVNSIANQRGVHLHFNKVFPNQAEAFVLAMSNITSANGIALQNLINEFVYREDTTPPSVQEVVVAADKRSVEIVFSESLSPQNPNPELMTNYTLTCPANDSENFITDIEFQDDAIMVSFASPLKHSSSAYVIAVRNVRDLAGNVISPQFNLARFYAGEIHDLKNVKVFPNPVMAKTQPWCSFIHFPEAKPGRIKIYDNSGNLVLSQDIGPFNYTINNVTWNWDLKNNYGRQVSSGVYFYVIEMDGKIARGKVAVIN